MRWLFPLPLPRIVSSCQAVHADYEIFQDGCKRPHALSNDSHQMNAMHATGVRIGAFDVRLDGLSR